MSNLIPNFYVDDAFMMKLPKLSLTPIGLQDREYAAFTVINNKRNRAKICLRIIILSLL